MAFANLFTSLTLPTEDVTSPPEPASTEREEGKLEPEKNNERKRPWPTQQGGPKKKKKKKKKGAQQSPSKQAKGISSNKKDSHTSYKDFDLEARDHHMQRLDYEQPGLDFSKELDLYRCAKKADQGNDSQGCDQNNGVQHKDRKIQKADQQQPSNWEGNSTERGGVQANGSRDFASARGRVFTARGGQRAGRHQGWVKRGSDTPGKTEDCYRAGGGSRTDQRGHFRDTERFQSGGRTQQFRGGGKHSKRFIQAPVVERKQEMTKEFKEQNVIEKDGRFICRHFLMGKCIKGDECQLEHALDVHNNNFNEACKFDIQGPLPSGQQSCPKKKRKKKKGAQQSPSKQAKGISSNKKDSHTSYKDFDLEAKDHHMQRLDYEQPGLDFSKELDLYRCAKKADQGNDSQGCDQNNGVQHKDRKIQKADQQQPSNWEGNSTERGGVQANGSRDFASTRGRVFTARGGQRAGRHQGWAKRGSDTPGKTEDCYRAGGGSRTDQRGHFRDTERFQRGGRTQRFRGGGKHSKRFIQAPVVERKQEMTKEFKEQNVIEKDGRLICRHFLMGKCIKGDACQLEHALDVHNNIFNEACKFYIQGACNKGASCPYIHEAFPCKFFHLYRCYQGDDCRFSHEPLNDFTRQLLDEALKKENDLKDLANVVQPMNTEDAVLNPISELKDLAKVSMNTQDAVDIFLNPIRPSFYNSSCPSEPDAAKSAPLWNKAVTPEVAEKETLHKSLHDLDPPPSPPGCKEPVSYSIEAVLGSHKPFEHKPFFHSVLTNPSSQSSGHSSQLDRTSSSADCKGKAVEGVLGSQKHQEKPFCSLFAGAVTEDSGARLRAQAKRSAECKSKVSNPDETVLGSSKPFETHIQEFFSLYGQAKRCPDPPHASHGSKGPLSYSDTGVLETQKTQETSFRSLFAGPICQATAPKRPAHTLTTPCGPPKRTQSPHLPGATDDKGKVPRFVESVVSSKPLKTPFKSLFAGPIGRNSTPQLPNPTIQSTLTTHHKDSIHTPGPPPSSRESKVKPLKTPFHNLFSGLIDQSPNHASSTEKSPDPPSSSPGHEGEVPCSRESHKPLDKPFRSLFAGPIGETATPRSPTRTKLDPFSAKAKDRLPEPTSDKEPSKILKSLFLRLSPCRHEGEREGNRNVKGHKDTGNYAFGLDDKCRSTGGPVYTEKRRQKKVDERTEEDEGETDRTKESDKRDEPVAISSTPRLSLGNPRHSLQVDVALPLHPSATKVYPDPDPDPEGVRARPSPQDSISQEAAVERCPPIRGQVQLGTSGFHNLPIQSMALMTRPHTNSNPRTMARKTRGESGNVGARPLKDLFSTFDPTASPFESITFGQYQ